MSNNNVVAIPLYKNKQVDRPVAWALAGQDTLVRLLAGFYRKARFVLDDGASSVSFPVADEDVEIVVTPDDPSEALSAVLARAEGGCGPIILTGGVANEFNDYADYYESGPVEAVIYPVPGASFTIDRDLESWSFPLDNLDNR